MDNTYDPFEGDAELAATFQVAAMVGRDLLDRYLSVNGLTDRDVGMHLARLATDVTALPTATELRALGSMLVETIDRVAEASPDIAASIDAAAAIHENVQELRGFVGDLAGLIGVTALSIGFLLLIAKSELSYRDESGRLVAIVHKGIPANFQTLTDGMAKIVNLGAGGNPQTDPDEKAPDSKP